MDSKRYDKFKNNNLPTPFWDEERQVFEYVYFDDDLEVNNNLADAFSDIIFDGFYFPFTAKRMIIEKEKDEYVTKIEIGKCHAHTFDEVVQALYESPESFKINKEDKEYYSKQELDYLNQLQKYLLFIDMKDISEDNKGNRYNNKKRKKYAKALIYSLNNKAIKNIEDGKRNFRVIEWYPEFNENKKYKKGEYQALITDEDKEYKFFVEFTSSEVKEYKDIKDVCNIAGKKDNDKLIVYYFNILERF